MSYAPAPPPVNQPSYRSPSPQSPRELRELIAIANRLTILTLIVIALLVGLITLHFLTMLPGQRKMLFGFTNAAGMMLRDGSDNPTMRYGTQPTGMRSFDEGTRDNAYWT